MLRNMTGAEIDYTIMDVDREGGVAIGSRRMAMLARRHFFDTARNGHELGEKLTCRVLSVGPKRCLVECGGRDMSLSQKDLTYTATPDLRERYHPGQELDCILKEYNRQSGQMWVSVKETMANPSSAPSNATPSAAADRPSFPVNTAAACSVRCPMKRCACASIPPAIRTVTSTLETL